MGIDNKSACFDLTLPFWLVYLSVVKLHVVQVVFKTCLVALLASILWSGAACAQSTNGIPIVIRKHHYSSQVQLLPGAGDVVPPAPVPADEDAPPDNNLKMTKVDEEGSAPAVAPPPARRRNPKKELEKDPTQAFLAADPEHQTNTEASLMKFGWLADDAEANRKYLRAQKEPKPDEPGLTNSLTSTASTNGTNHVQLGSLTEYAFKPVHTHDAETANVERVVQDRVAHDAEKKKQEVVQRNAAAKEGLDLAGKRDMPTLLTATNETLGLGRSRKEEATTLDVDFQQTRKALAEITTRYQLNYSLADAVRPASTPETPQTDAARITPDKDKPSWRTGEVRRPAGFSDGLGSLMIPTATLAPSASSPAAMMPAVGNAWGKPSSGSLALPVISASGLVEPPKMLKASEMQSAPSAWQSPPAAPSVSNPINSPFTPSGFTPTTPYQTPFGSSLSR